MVEFGCACGIARAQCRIQLIEIVVRGVGADGDVSGNQPLVQAGVVLSDASRVLVVIAANSAVHHAESGQRAPRLRCARVGGELERMLQVVGGVEPIQQVARHRGATVVEEQCSRRRVVVVGLEPLDIAVRADPDHATVIALQDVRPRVAAVDDDRGVVAELGEYRLDAVHRNRFAELPTGQFFHIEPGEGRRTVGHRHRYHIRPVQIVDDAGHGCSAVIGKDRSEIAERPLADLRHDVTDPGCLCPGVAAVIAGEYLGVQQIGGGPVEPAHQILGDPVPLDIADQFLSGGTVAERERVVERMCRGNFVQQCAVVGCGIQSQQRDGEVALVSQANELRFGEAPEMDQIVVVPRTANGDRVLRTDLWIRLRRMVVEQRATPLLAVGVGVGVVEDGGIEAEPADRVAAAPWGCGCVVEGDDRAGGLTTAA